MRDLFGALVGGRLCLEFVNTVAGRAPRPPSVPRSRTRTHDPVGDRLTSYAALAAWASYTRTVAIEDARILVETADRSPGDSQAVLARALALRESLFRVFCAGIDERALDAGDLETVNDEIQAARPHERLVVAADRSARSTAGVVVPSFGWRWEAGNVALDCMLWPVARSAAELLTSPDLRRVGRCPGETCGRLFLDTSRAGRRLWCEMATCGNADKVRRFRQRQRAQQSHVSHSS